MGVAGYAYLAYFLMNKIMKKKQCVLPIILSVTAIVLGAYATFATYQIKKGGANDANFKANVFAAIDDYIAEKSKVEVSVDDDAMKGDEKAPVTIIEFTDYQCPYCGRYVKETYPQIVKNYIETGKVRYVLRDFPLGGHAQAAGAANAAECVREQGGDAMYWEYHDVLFTNQSDLSVEKLKEHAADLDIDQEKFASCVDEKKFEKEVSADFNAGVEAGVRGTPAFFINGMPLSGAQPYQSFVDVIEQALSN